MSNPHKPLAAQVMVITGATSRIGLTTARMASRQGAILVLAARNVSILERLASEIRLAGGQVLAMPVDVASKEQVAALGRAAVARFGRIDSWVNAGMALEDREDVKPTRVAARLFTSHYWGAAHGATVAFGLMKQEGGAIINVDSDGSAKHGVKALTDALRADIASDGTAISVTLVHAAGNDLPGAPRLVAEAILHAAEHGQRDMLVGAAARVPASRVRLHFSLTPRLLEKCVALFTARPSAGGTPRPFP